MLVTRAINTSASASSTSAAAAAASTNALLVSHDGNLIKATDREPANFEGRLQPDFLEDGVIVMRAESFLNIVDALAASTLDHTDLPLRLRRHKASVWFTPSGPRRVSRVGVRVPTSLAASPASAFVPIACTGPQRLTVPRRQLLSVARPPSRRCRM